MTTTIPLCVMIDWQGDAATLIALLSELLGQSLAARSVDDSTVHAARLLDTELLLIPDHRLEDDGGIEFSCYAYQLQLVALDSGRFLSNYAGLYERLGGFLAQRVATGLGCSTELVANLQTSLARFQAKGGS